MDVGELLSVVLATNVNDNTKRRQAESRLAELAHMPGFLAGLVSVITHPDVPFAGQLSSALAFKNAIERHWHNDSPGAPQRYSDAEKNTVRDAILDVAVSMPALPLINALTEAIYVIFRHDFPARWPDFTPKFMSLLQSGDSHKTLVVLMVFRDIVKVCELDRTRAREIFLPIVEEVMPVLLSLAQLVIDDVHTDDAGHCLRLALKIYFSLTQNNLDEFPCLLERQSFIAWCIIANKAMSKHLPAPGEAGEPSGQPTSDDAREHWVWWRVKKWGVKIFYRIAQAWGQPEGMDEGDARNLATFFNKNVAPEACRTYVTLLHEWIEEGRWISRKVLFYGLHFVQSCLDFSSAWKSVMKAELPFVLQQVVFTLYRMTPVETEAIERDPYEYLRINADSAFGSTEPRSSASLLLWAALEARKAATEPVLDTMLTQGLALYESQTPEERDPQFKEALMYLIQELHQWLVTDKKRKKWVEGLLVNHVTPELTSPFPYLRARAVSVWARFADVRFKNKGAVNDALTGVYALMSDPVLVVRLTAGGSISAFLVRSQTARRLMRPHFMDMLKCLFAMLDDMGMDQVVRTVGVLCEAYYEELPEIAQPLIERLASLWFDSLPDPADSAIDMDDDNALLGEGLLNTIQVVIGQLLQSERVDVVLACMPVLWRLVDSLMAKEGPTLEFIDSGFDIFADVLVCIEERLAVEDEVWRLYAKMIDFYTSCALDYTSSLLSPVDCMYSYAPDRFALEVDPATGVDNAGILCEAAAFVEEKADETERGWFGKVMLGMMHNCRGKVDRVVPGIARLYGAACCNAHTKYLLSQSFTVIASCLMYSPELTLVGLESVGATEAVFSAWMVGVASQYYRKSPDVKLSMLGLANLLRTVPLASMPGALAGMVPQLLSALASLQLQFETLLQVEAQLRAEKAEMDEEADEDVPDFREDDAFEAAGMGDEVDSDYDFDEEEEDGVEVEHVDDDTDYIGPQDKANILNAKIHATETAEDRDKRLQTLMADADVGDHIPPKRTPIDHIDHFIWMQAAVLAVGAQSGAELVQAAVPAAVQHALATIVDTGSRHLAEGKVEGAFGPAPEGWKGEGEKEA